MIKSRKAIIAVILALIVVLVVAMYIINREGEAQQLIDLEKFFYARFLDFGFRIVINGNTHMHGTIVNELIVLGSNRFDPFYTDLVFVQSRAEAEGFPDNIVVAWPTVGGGEAAVELLQEAVDRTENELNEVRWLNGRAAVTLEQFGLTQPLTVEDLVDNWEKVNALFNALSVSERSTIMRMAQLRMDLEAEGFSRD